MNLDEVKARLDKIEGITHLKVDGDGYHFHIDIVSPIFEGLSRLNRQKHVYRYLQDLIANGSLHAVNLKIYTPSEWNLKYE
ncbi:MAG: BolA/IbaG family iron-sulfur metabolism protein [Gammaproteobacteria bacterium]|nr:BolA/IbaG family iron-sulfur metabolism protein [Gammaproteobacteria bacterium]